MSVQNTHTSPFLAGALLARPSRIWFIGIGGVQMASLARHLAPTHTVAGSDVREGMATAALRAAGIPVYIGHHPKRAAAADVVVFTLAISPEDPEYLAARAAGVPLLSRADLLGALMRRYKTRITVAGTHGKSTVTAMLAEILLGAGREPAVFCGAAIPSLGDGYYRGAGVDLLAEACEYRDSFLCLSPTLAVTLNVELDHVDYFADRAALVRSFAAYAALPGGEGTHLYFADDPSAVIATKGSPAQCVGFGTSERAAFCIKQVTLERGFGRFYMQEGEGKTPPIQLRIPGYHNILNAAAAYSAARLSGVDAAACIKALEAFRGAARRMEYRGVWFGARFYDDYAHHPTEVRAALETARLLLGCGGRLFAVFQSHTYTRTEAFSGELCAALSLADRVLIADIYAAREQDTRGMSGTRLAAEIGDNAVYIGGIPEIAETLASELAPLDLVVVMGAGDIDRLFLQFPKKDFTSEAE